MIQRLITLPLRTARFGAELLVDGASRAASLALALTGHSRAPQAQSRPSAEAQPQPSARPADPAAAPPPPPPSPEPPPPTRPAEPAAAPPPPPPSPGPPPPARPTAPASPEPAAPLAAGEPEPAHIEDETELVAEVADPGAEDGAGAELRIDEPWPGYRQLKADDIIARLAAASAAELAVIELYEATHKRRRTVLSALQRQLRDQARNGTADRP